MELQLDKRDYKETTFKFLSQLLKYEPGQRIKPLAALRDPFFEPLYNSRNKICGMDMPENLFHFTKEE